MPSVAFVWRSLAAFDGLIQSPVSLILMERVAQKESKVAVCGLKRTNRPKKVIEHNYDMKIQSVLIPFG